MPDIALIAPLQLDELAKHGIPAELAGADGINRAHNMPKQIAAETDLEAIFAWLNEFPEGSSTRRAYHKEVQRFYAWVLAFSGKPLSSLMREDLENYRAFMAAPPETWCAPRYHRRGTGLWRPFEKPLSLKSQGQAIIVINALFSYLVDAHYLAGNPLAIMRRKRKGVTKRQRGVPKSIPLHTFERLVEALQSECERLNGLGSKHVEMERMLMVIRVLGNTGMRRGELATALAGDIYQVLDPQTRKGNWFITVTGKGDVTDQIAFNPAAVSALHRYQRVIGIDPHHADPKTPLVVPLGVHGLSAAYSETVTDQTIYNIVRKALRVGAKIIKADSPAEASFLSKATPHYFRHTFATLMSDMGFPLPLIQKQLRHASIETTVIYTETEKHQLYRAVATLAL
ncbi:tyrosine-type recombinase/integrase [Ralstonia sp. ASV6]|uniref:tyrosine-type recombinase/integrase n=1 Tax=Ralstonia sp. ASV6 TaxID=2795124 RepID=UPI0018EDEFF4|nr:tyrosine-type recombinase/integrase [Ralstonia sp. ASV6]